MARDLVSHARGAHVVLLAEPGIGYVIPPTRVEEHQLTVGGDVVVVALRYPVSQVLFEAWPGQRSVMERLLGNRTDDA